METYTITLEDRMQLKTIEPILKEVKNAIQKGIVIITIDCRNIEGIDSSGIGCMVKIHNSLKEKKGYLAVTNLNSDIRKMFTLMRLDQHIRVEH